jgi:tRNA (cmo5U34)-methyltransferase
MTMPPNSAFSDPAAVARYAEGPVRMVPGYHALHQMTALLLAETIGPQGQVLVLGAGGGLELKAFAGWYPGWRFTGVDPSAEMLDLARRTLDPLSDRVDWHQGTIDTAPPGPFDAATCLLTLHFLEPEERLQTLVDLRHRLKPGAPLVVAHHSVPREPGARTLWLNRFAAFAAANGMAPDMAQNAAKGIGERLPMLSPEQDVSLLQQAGFVEVQLFYAAFTFRGWVARNPVPA